MSVIAYSAHSDDLSYSIPLFLRSLQRKGGNIIVKHVFSDTDYAPNLQNHERGYVGSIRSEELLVFCRQNGYQYDCLGFSDACLREDYLNKEVCHFFPLTSDDRNLVSRISSEMDVADLYLFPLAIGNHVDHRILMEVGKWALILL